MLKTEETNARRIELILRQIDALPTLPTVATRLLTLTASDESSAKEVIRLVSSDPSLTAKILSLCATADRGLREDVMTIDKAVLLLGFNTIRNAVLSIKVFETLGPKVQHVGTAETIEDDAPGLVFDRTSFWRHSLAVGIAAELICEAERKPGELAPGEAFVCGLLHDIGKLALDHVLPKSFARVLELTELNQGNISEFERRILGLDHHTAGKRLAEQWQLPHRLQDAIWLHGSAFETLPRLDHKRLIGVVSLADLIVRRQHLGYSGNFVLRQSPNELAEKLQLQKFDLDTIEQRLRDELERRASAMGLDDTPSQDLFLQSIQQANEVLGRLNGMLDRRSRSAARQAQILEAINEFHQRAMPGRSVQDVLNSVAGSAHALLGDGFYAMLYPTDDGNDKAAWLISQYQDGDRVAHSQLIDPPPHAPDLRNMDNAQLIGMNMMGVLPWIVDYLMQAPDVRDIKLIPLACGWGTSAVLLHNQPTLPPWPQMAPLVATWGAAIAAATQHDGARRLGEELAAANNALADAQDRLLAAESMARLGEMAAGAAHEMNNPLAVISGRSQLLAMSLSPGSKEQSAAQTVFEQAHRLSNLITSLRMFADPPEADRKKADMGKLLSNIVKTVRTQVTSAEASVPIDLQIKGELPAMYIDTTQIDRAVTELVVNAVQSQPRTGVSIIVQTEPTERVLMIQVSDDGIGMDAHTLDHAMDPFFSAKPAGRRVGMGLTIAQQMAAGHGGRIELRTQPGRGTVASLILPLDSLPR
jgi:signal transduction histidine kinase/HD-like signal output (HDOD) protein